MAPPDYLSEGSRKVRRALLLACSAAGAWTWLGLVPERIVALGVEFDRIDQRRFKWFILAVLIYFLVEFLVFIRRDYVYLLFEQPLLSPTMAEKIPERDNYKWGFWIWRFTTPQIFRHPGKRVIRKLMLRDVLAGWEKLRTTIVPIPIYGFQSWMDVWIPLALAGVVIVSLLCWTPRVPPYIPWP